MTRTEGGGAQLSLPPLTYSSLHRYNTNVNHPDYNESWFDKRMVGFEDMPTQAEWLLSLTEDLERHSSACQHGCAPEADRVCVGGSIMAWVDEWWKGRVIEATSFDTRTDTMGDLCPDCLLYTSPSPRDRQKSRMPSSA